MPQQRNFHLTRRIKNRPPLPNRPVKGRSAVRLAPLIAKEGVEEEMWFPLGRGEWTNPQGPVSGRGLRALSASETLYFNSYPWRAKDHNSDQLTISHSDFN
jgi:hypothetical protein